MKERIQSHYRSTAEDYTEQYRPSYTGYPANQKRLAILVDRVRTHRPRTLLDCGCGEGSPMRRLQEEGVQVWGFDLVPEMVEQGQRVLASSGSADRIWQGDITDPTSFRAPGGDDPPTFDMTLAMGVFPHIADERQALRNMADATTPGGHVLVEFRNELFSLFTVNRYSYSLITEELIGIPRLRQEHPDRSADLDAIAERLRSFYRLDQPPPRLGEPDAPGYDAILSKFDNPLTIGRIFEDVGLRVNRLFFYHFHAVPPLFESEYSGLFRQLSLTMERDPSDWRGHFMASAFVVEAVKASA